MLLVRSATPMHVAVSCGISPRSTLLCPTLLTRSWFGQAQRPKSLAGSAAFARRTCQRRYSGAVVLAASQETPAQEQGQISSELMQQMKNSITSNLEADRVDVTDVYGDGRHVNIEVVSKLFEGQTSVKRQRLVYKVSMICSMGITLSPSYMLLHAAGNLARAARHSTCC